MRVTEHMFLVKHVSSNPLEYFDVWIISCLKVKHVLLIAHRKTKETTNREKTKNSISSRNTLKMIISMVLFHLSDNDDMIYLEVKKQE